MKFYLNAYPFAATIEEFKRGVKLAGSDPVRFQHTLKKVAEHSVIADEGGMEGICFSEQHSNIEGMPEVTSNPILLDAFVAMHTKRLKVGQLGMTVTANHPVRLAEDIATLDHLVGGRMFSGFTRGNSPRWVNTFAQHYGIQATSSDKSAVDEQNMRAMKEAWHIIKLAWTQETFRYDGEFWKVPADDIQWDYPPTRTFGQGMDANGKILEIGIVPRPLQKPHPRVFAPLAWRMTTVRFWVSEGATAVCYADKDEFLKTAWDVLGEEAAKAGIVRTAPPLAPAAFLMVGKDRAAAEELLADAKWLFATGYSVPPFNVPMGRLLVGTPDEVSRQIEQMLTIAPFEEMFLWHNIALHRDQIERESLELFVEKVLPRFASGTPADSQLVSS